MADPDSQTAAGSALAAPDPGQSPRISGGFRIHEEVGRGGMGVVYRAEEIASGRIVALKSILPGFACTSDALQRFHREARLTASISHPNCVFVYGAHEIDGAPVIAMEWMAGGTLEDRIRSGEPIPVATAVRWILDVLEGLEAAHLLGVVHRDIKPSNCFLTSEGQIKVGDFGLARALEADVRLTQTGQFLGSPLYAPAEQIRGDAVDARSDVYSCAATLYALLTGKPPYPGTDLGRVIARILTEDPVPPRQLRPEIPGELEQVVLRSLQRDRTKRHPDTESLRTALLPFAGEDVVAATVPRRLGAYIVDTCVLSGLSILVMSVVYGTDSTAWLTLPLWKQVAQGLLPFAYFAVSEGWRGSSVGKWLFRLRVVSTGDGPSRRVRILLRTFLFQLPATLVLFPIAAMAHDPTTQGRVGMGAAVVVWAFYVSTMRRRNGWRGPHELLSRTRVVQSLHESRRVRRSTSAPETYSQPAAGLPEKIGAYRVKGMIDAGQGVTLLHAQDERLDRSVWIHVRDSAPSVGDRRRTLSRPARLRWLEELSVGDAPGDVFESPGGCSLRDSAARGVRFEWPAVERMLSSLAEELAHCEQESGGSLAFALSQVWLDRNGNVRLLDAPLIAREGGDLDAIGLMGATARTLLTGGQAGSELPAELPLHAEPLVKSLIGSAPPHPSLDALRAALAASRATPATVELRTRAAQLAIHTAPSLMFLGVVLIGVLLVGGMFPSLFEVRTVLKELERNQISGRQADGVVHPLDDAGRQARQLVLSYELSHAHGPSISASLNESDRPVIEEARRAFPEVSEADYASALHGIRAERGQGPTDDANLFQDGGFLVTGFCAGIAIAWSVFALITAWIWPGGLSFRLLGLSLRTRRGHRVRRWLGFVRTAAFAVPLCVALGASTVLYKLGQVAPAWTLFGLAALAVLLGLVFSLLHPSRGPIDRVLGTRIVPR